MPHVTFFKIKAKPGEHDTVVKLFKGWSEERGPKVKGFVRSVLASSLSNPDEFMAGAMFDTKENYDANSNDPEQGKWYEELRSHLVADPDWFDANVEMVVEA